jgi:ComF family protein
MELLYQFINLLFPKTCAACKNVLLKSENILCTNCLIDLPKTDIGFSNSLSSQARFLGKTPIVAVHTFLKYSKGGNVQRLLHNLKYKNRQDIGLFLGNLFGKKLLDRTNFYRPDILIAVPLHARKKVERGYNQSELIADGLSNSINVPHETGILIRKKATETQTKKTRIERYVNVDDVFEVIAPTRIMGKSIGLVDDVLTTGATMEICAGVLLKAGAKEIIIFSLASAI